MRIATRRNVAKLPTALLETIPAPDEGWDAVSSLTDMDPRRAILLDNLTCRPGYVEFRKGHYLFASGMGGNVESLIVYRGALEKMFGAADGKIWDISSGGAASSVVTGMSNDRWQYINYSTTGGNYVLAVNGGDAPRQFDGTTWTASTISGTGLTPANLIDVMAHKRRIYLVEKNTLQFWYLPVGSITGTAVKFDLGPIFTEGGTLAAVGTWTFDGGNGVDDYAVFITDQGEVAIYQGDDPGSSSAWALVGQYRIGFPLSRRSVLKTGGDLAIITSDGIVPLSQALRTDRAASGRFSLTARIQNQFAAAVTAYKSNFGWDGIAYPAGNLAIFNVPVIQSSVSHQYVINVITGGWSRWTGQNAFCWAIYDDKLYFGGASGRVFQADKGSLDYDQPITVDLKTAFNYFKRRGQRKRFTMVRPIIRTDGTVNPAIEINADYEESTPTAQATVVVPDNLGLWDVGLWDDAVWGDELKVRNDWTGASGIGVCGAVRMQATYQGGSTSNAVDTTVHIIGFDVQYEPGGYI